MIRSFLISLLLLAVKINKEFDLVNAQIITDGKSLKIAHPEGFLIITEIQLPNKRRMIASDLLNGYQFSASAEVK